MFRYPSWTTTLEKREPGFIRGSSSKVQTVTFVVWELELGMEKGKKRYEDEVLGML